MNPLGMVGQFEMLQEVRPGEEVLGTGETLEGDGGSVGGCMVLQTCLSLESFLTVWTLEPRLCELVSQLVFPHMLRVDKGGAALPALIRSCSLMLRVDVTVQQAASPELHPTDIALVPSLPQVDVSHVGLQVLLLIEP